MPNYLKDLQLAYPRGVGTVNNYTVVPGACILPLAEDPPTEETELQTYSPVVVLRLHAPYRVREVVYDTKKNTNPPVLPSPADAGAFVFTGGTLMFVPHLTTDITTMKWDVLTSYTYVENCPHRVEDGFVIGSPPYPDRISNMNKTQYGVPPGPQVGAIAQAGQDALVGWQMDQVVVVPNLGTGAWIYNAEAYFPGSLFSDSLVNGGPPRGV